MVALPRTDDSTASRAGEATVPRTGRWTIAAAMLQFPAVLPDGSRVQDASADTWQTLLAPIAREGFTAVEVPSAWLRVGDLSATRRRDFGAVLRAAGLGVPGVSVVRESVIHPAAGLDNLAFSHRTIDAAAELGVPIVCLGLHDDLIPAQKRALWFWTVPGAQRPSDPAVREVAVRRCRELARHADAVGVQISLELYEDTYLGTAAEAVKFIADIDHPAAGLNPDLANLVRRQGPVERWEHIAEVTLPLANYWHVKNISRAEDPARGLVLTTPCPLEQGFINYRSAVATAVESGYHGALVVEHYGGDGLSVGATNRDYLRRVLPP